MPARPYIVKAVPAFRGEWRVEIAAGNGAVLMQSTKCYTTKGACERAAEQFASAAFAFVKGPRENARG